MIGLLYQCRRCGVHEERPHPDPAFAMRHMVERGKLLEDVHVCRDGGLGVAELVGTLIPDTRSGDREEESTPEPMSQGIVCASAFDARGHVHPAPLSNESRLRAVICELVDKLPKCDYLPNAKGRVVVGDAVYDTCGRVAMFRDDPNEQPDAVPESFCCDGHRWDGALELPWAPLIRRLQVEGMPIR